jgi:hypothetical protein
MEAELTSLYKNYKHKSKTSWIQIHAFNNFDDVLRKIREREIANQKEIDTVRRVTSKI